MNLMAVGFKDGSVLLLRGNITRDRVSKTRVIHREQDMGVHITGKGGGGGSVMHCNGRGLPRIHRTTHQGGIGVHMDTR